MTDDDIEDEVNLSTAAELLAGRKPLACCPYDGEPLIFTMEQPKAEFHCMICGKWFGFLSPRPMKSTPELEMRHGELQAKFNAGERGPI